MPSGHARALATLAAAALAFAAVVRWGLGGATATLWAIDLATLAVASAGPGQGSTFWLRLPWHDAAVASGPQAVAPAGGR